MVICGGLNTIALVRSGKSCSLPTQAIVFRVNSLRKKFRSETLVLMANSQGTERKRLTMVIKTSAYKIGSRFFYKLPRLKISSKENIGCGYLTKELTGSKQTGNLLSF